MKVKLKYERTSIKGGRSEEEWEKMKFFNIILCKWGKIIKKGKEIELIKTRIDGN
jgi:hypothetical protein